MEYQSRIAALTTARNRAWHEGEELVRRAERERRSFTADEEAKWERVNRELDDLDGDITNLVELETRAREATEARSPVRQYLHIPSSGPAHLGDNDVMAFLRGERRFVEFDLRGVAAERRMRRAGAGGREYRDLIEDSATAGGYTVPTSFLRTLYDFLEQFSGVRKLNCTFLTTASGEALQVPKVTSHGTAVLTGEGTALAENDPVFGQVTLNAWKFGVLTQISTEMLVDSGIDALGFVAKDAARAIGRATDTDYVTGNGTNKPNGIRSTLGTGATAQTGSTGVPSFSNLIDLCFSVNPEYRANSAQWFMQDSTVGKLRRITDTTGQPIWQPSVIGTVPDLLLGYPVVTDAHMDACSTAASTAKPIAFGDWNCFAVRDAGALRFERSDDFSFNQDLVTFRTILRTDSDLIDLTGAAKLLIDPTS